MSSDLAISARGVSKRYQIGSATTTHSTLTETALSAVRRGFRKPPSQSFYALDDVSFDLRRGEALGVVGRNGAGKSTLLKILSRVTAPTAGEIDIYGRVGSLLEVGTGFHPELTGRENVFMNGAILGMRRSEIKREFDSIVEFSEIGKFLDTPVKRYSSGMYVRLAFAVAAHLNPDILIIDEVLAVGDMQFQKKCLGKMGEVTANEGRTVMFVSHNLTAVEAICTRCIVLDAGKVTFSGDTRDAVAHYIASADQGAALGAGNYDLSARRAASLLRSLTLCDQQGVPSDRIGMGEQLTVKIGFDPISPTTQMVTIRFRTDDGQLVAGVHSHLRTIEILSSGQKANEAVVRFPSLPFQPGSYYLDIEISEGRKGHSTIDLAERAATLEVLPTNLFGSGWQTNRGPRYGTVLLDPQWELCRGDVVVGRSQHADTTSRVG